MSRKKHSIGLKLFIFVIVAMMLFSAIGVMVIYLNGPTNMMMPVNTIPADPTPAPITIPGETNTLPEGTPSEVAPGEEVEGTPEPTNPPAEELPSEDLPADAPEVITPPVDAELPPAEQNDVE